MKRLGIHITLSFLAGILLGNKIPLLLCYLFLFICCTGLGVLYVLREKITYKNFNRLFITGTALVFLGLGVQRKLLQTPDNQNVIFDKVEAVASKIRGKISIRITSLLPEKPSEQAVARALILGDKSKLSKELKNSYKEAGVMHTLALSGMHVGIIWGIIELMLYPLLFSSFLRGLRLPLSLAIIFGYAIITGLSPSVLRASVMLAIVMLSKSYASGKIAVLCFTAFLLSYFSPDSLSLIGFQLSFAATAGIVFLYPIINQSITNVTATLPIFLKKIIAGALSLMGISIACQIFTLPLTLLYFRQFPEYYLLANLAVIPIVTLVVWSLIFALLLQPLPLIGPVTSYLSGQLLTLLNSVVQYLN